MELLRRRANGRLAELFGQSWVSSDRRFRISGVNRYCVEAVANLPDDARQYLHAYAAGVNAFVQGNPEAVQNRFAPLGITPEPWSAADCVCAWLAVGELFDSLYDQGPITSYHEFEQLVAQMGEEEALKQREMVIDDAAAIVPESEMAKEAEIYQRLKATPPIPGILFKSFSDDLLKFSHAWAVGGSRSTTGKPILESDPQTTVNNPPLWYEFHLSAGRFDVRGVGVAGSPGLLIGFNRKLAWGATALGASSTISFLEKLAPGGEGYLYKGQTLPFERRQETIRVKDRSSVVVDVVRTRHGFVFNDLVSGVRAGEAYVSHNRQFEAKATSILGMLGMMAAGNWTEFRAGMRDYFSPGIHVVYADVEGNLGYQTLVHVPLTRRTRKMALEGWTGADEVLGRIPLDEMPHMLNPDTGFVSHANNLPVGSWYPYDIGIGTGGTGHSTRSLRLVELLSGTRTFSVDDFESYVHRDDVSANTAALFPIARRLAEKNGVTNPNVRRLLDALKDWDLRFRADQPTYPAAMVLAGNALLPYRRSPLNSRLGGGEGGISHLARLLKAQYGAGTETPSDPEVQQYLAEWLQAAADAYQQNGRTLAPADGKSTDILVMPYQTGGPLQFPAIAPEFDLTSPPLSCGQVGTIWSQRGNSYTQIVDLSDIDNSRTVLPPGISEDPESPHHSDQIDLWVGGTTHPAPLSRSKVEALSQGMAQMVFDAGAFAMPLLLSADGSGRGLGAANVQRMRSDGSVVWDVVARLDGTPTPIDLSSSADFVFLVLYGSGIRLRSSLDAVSVMVGGVNAQVLYAGPQGTYEGVDQVNVLLPRSLAGRGLVDVVLTFDGRIANAVQIFVR